MIKQFLNKILNFLLAQYYLILVSTTLFGLTMYPVEYLVYGYLYYYLFFLPVYTTVRHEYLLHGVLKPKNKFIEYFSFFVFHAYGVKMRNQRPHHVTHHKFADVKPHLDPVYLKIRAEGALKYILGFGRMYSTLDASKFTEDDHRGILSKDTWNFFNKYGPAIHLSVISIWLLFFPFWTWVTFYVYPAIIGITAGKVTDVYFHKWKGKDSVILMFFQCNQGWHRSHHVFHQDKRLNYEPWDYSDSDINKNWKYVNTQYYVQKLLYRPVLTS